MDKELNSVNEQDIVHKIIVYKMLVDETDFNAKESFEIKFEKWKNSEHGQYVLKNAQNINVVSDLSYSNYKYQKQYIAVAEFEEKKLVKYYLKWGGLKND